MFAIKKEGDFMTISRVTILDKIESARSFTK